MAEYVTDGGLTLPILADVIEEIDTELREEIHPLLHTEPDDLPGNLTGIFANHLQEVSELIQVAYKAFDPDAAEDDALDSVSKITGTYREGPQKARFAGTKRVTCNLEPGFTLPIGSMAHIDGEPENRWVSTETGTNSGGVAADVLITFEAETAGVRRANPNTLTIITTPVAGWNSVNNTTQPIPGSETEDNVSLRARRERELKQAGSGTVDAMTADLFAFEYDGEKLIKDALVLENVEDVPDPSTGLQPHSLECIVDEGIAPVIPNDAIAQYIFERKPGGTKLVGQDTGIATDKKGNQHTVPFSRPTIRYFQVALQLTIDAAKYTGITATRNIVIADADTNNAGEKARWSNVVDAVKAQPGVVAVNLIGLNWKGDAPGATFNDLTPELRQRALIELAADVGVLTNGS